MIASLPAQAVPGCVLCLLQLSESMQQPLPAAPRPRSKYGEARRFLNTLLDLLLARQRRGTLPAGFEIGVLGYRAEAGKPVEFLSLLPGADDHSGFCAVAELLARSPLGQNGRLDRLRGLEPSGEGAVSAALVRAYTLAEQWLQQHPGANPPLIVHCHDSTGLDELHGLVSRSFQVLSSPRGQVLLCNCVFSEAFASQLVPVSYAGDAPAPWHDLWNRSSPLPRTRRNQGGILERGLSINAGPEGMVRRLFSSEALAVATEATRVAADLGPSQIRALWFVRAGNADNEWEDAFEMAPRQGLAAISDGASEGIFAKVWSALLVRRLVQEQPDLADPDAVAAWLQDCRKNWREEINFPSLRGTQQVKVIDFGAAATLLSLRLQVPPPGAVAEEGDLLWQACAVGDSCLFWCRDNSLLASFPLVHSGQFTLGPRLLRTRVEGPDPVPLFAQGYCRPGDLFLLATDAVATQLFQATEEGTAVDWEGFMHLEESAWRDHIRSLRQNDKIVNDDCTLLCLRVDGKPGNSA